MESKTQKMRNTDEMTRLRREIPRLVYVSQAHHRAPVDGRKANRNLSSYSPSPTLLSF